jgi:MFS transporter, MFS domain-containing protein family, molybdate-anion transporter
MYLFVFLWVPSLQEIGGSTIPLGYIFSAFMISMMLGSIIYTTISTTTKRKSVDTALLTNPSHQGAVDSMVVLHARLAALLCGLAALLFAYSATGSGLSVERQFWAFCAFEACVGAYYPVIGMLRGALVANEVRATVRMIAPQSSIRHVLTIMHSCRHFLGFHPIFL